MRTGTFLCWLFGHKFVVERDEMVDYGLVRFREASKWCCRCGIIRAEGKS